MQRWEKDFAEMVPHDKGDWCLYTDHLEEIATLKDEANKYKSMLAESVSLLEEAIGKNNLQENRIKDLEQQLMRGNK